MARPPPHGVLRKGGLGFGPRALQFGRTARFEAPEPGPDPVLDQFHHNDSKDAQYDNGYRGTGQYPRQDPAYDAQHGGEDDPPDVAADPTSVGHAPLLPCGFPQGGSVGYPDSRRGASIPGPRSGANWLAKRGRVDYTYAPKPA